MSIFSAYLVGGLLKPDLALITKGRERDLLYYSLIKFTLAGIRPVAASSLAKRLNYAVNRKKILALICCS